MNYIVLDLEWNQALHKEQTKTKPVLLQGEIIQIGAVKTDENFNVLDTFKILIAPKYYTKMNAKVQNLTKITDDMLKTGFPFEEALKRFKDWCGKDFAVITWGSDDIAVFETNLKLYNKPPKWIQKHYDAQSIFDYLITKEGRQIALAEAMEKIGKKPYDAHDALNDAKSTAVICACMDTARGISEYKKFKKNKSKKKKNLKKRRSRKTKTLKDNKNNNEIT